VLCKRNRQILILTFWGGAAIVAGSMLTSFHQPFTLPSENIAALAPQPGWRVVHLLAAECGCSQRVSEYLATRGPLEGIHEQVLFIGGANPFHNRDILLARGFGVETAGNLEPFDLRGVPLLIFISPKNEIAYMGGYGVGSYRDAEIWKRLQAGSAVPLLPVFGCAIGANLKRG